MTDLRQQRRSRISTRVLLICQAFGALGALILAGVAPFTSLTAVVSPPLYALLAGMHSVLPFLARRVLRWPFAATTVSFSVGLLGGAFTPVGLLIMIPLTLSGAAYDLVLVIGERGGAQRAGAHRVESRAMHPVAAAASAVVLFAVSLPVISPEQLTVPILAATLVGRLAGELMASLLAGVLARRIERAGILRRPAPTAGRPPG